ncbi:MULTISPECIES: hypothetical protein [Marinobacter]|jgi:hypothetical protein|uniref:hypothetical protein n=1 Tax=Marinobacter TaxID=2742 RepID=UPI0007D8F011|nr:MULTISPECIES: hypothetical protein [unclassified Marinobacter]MBL3826617.1 hypothetical protein [Marinobacter sp. MC3]MBL3895174.1 hypothetical protein [Marinobacter sp. MW3]OAN93280.1 hypothetical protein A8B80_17085 [Marinobacter sp. EhN04]OAN94289.1 hypothetical protein A8B84_19515 [Marinobacter sp. EhC06]
MKNLIRRFSVKQILLSDVFVSTPLALALILAAEPIAQWAGGPSATFYLVVGIVMLLWCVDMAAMAINERWQERYLNVMIAADVAWSLLAAALMVWFAESLQPLGWVLFALNVLVPLDMAWMKRVAGSKPQQPAFG